MAASNRALGAGARRRELAWEGAAIACGGICLSVQIWWVGVPLAATGLYLVVRSRRDFARPQSAAR